MKHINTKKELIELAKELGVRRDWHEPDEQDLTAVVKGKCFDNAGFWPGPFEGLPKNCVELHVILKKNKKPIAVINLATLLAWACGTYND